MNENEWEKTQPGFSFRGSLAPNTLKIELGRASRQSLSKKVSLQLTPSLRTVEC